MSRGSFGRGGGRFPVGEIGVGGWADHGYLLSFRFVAFGRTLLLDS